MVREELIHRSPLRILENSIDGGVGAGNIGVIASPKGVGKTACLVHIATDQLFQDKHVIHVSFAGRTDHIISWYEDIFSEIARRRNLDSAMQVHDEIIKNRVVMNFNQEGITAEQFLSSIRAMIEDGGFAADTIIIDGYDFLKGSPENIAKTRSFAADMGLSVWFSASLPPDKADVDGRGIPVILGDYEPHLSVIITLASTQDHVMLYLVKDHERYTREDLRLQLDPKSLLIASQ
jgi:hypothetical protein